MKKFNKTIIDEFGNKSNMLFERTTGSRLYGTQYELGEHPFWDDYISDWDFRGVFAIDPNVKLMMPPFNLYEKNIKLTEFDVEFYELEKFFSESIKNNPNYMDLLFANDKSLLGVSKAGQLILDNKDLFLSNKIANSFNGFAQSQLSRIKGHKKWLTKYPDIYNVEELIKKAYLNNDVSATDIAFNFSAKLRDKIKLETDYYNPKFINISFNDMLIKYFSNVKYDIYSFMKPYVYDFITLYSSDAKKIELTAENLKFLKETATFKKKNESLYFIYDGGKGVFLDNRSIHISLPVKANEAKSVSMIMTIDYANFKSKKDNIDSLWEWKAKRNGRRADLEKRFGYDVKHAMHTYRLLDGAIDTFENGTYTPELSKDRLKDAKSVLSGEFSYAEIINESDKKIKKLLNFKNKKIFNDQPNIKYLNEIYMEVLNLSKK